MCIKLKLPSLHPYRMQLFTQLLKNLAIIIAGNSHLRKI